MLASVGGVTTALAAEGARDARSARAGRATGDTRPPPLLETTTPIEHVREVFVAWLASGPQPLPGDTAYVSDFFAACVREGNAELAHLAARHLCRCAATTHAGGPLGSGGTHARLCQRSGREGTGRQARPGRGGRVARRGCDVRGRAAIGLCGATRTAAAHEHPLRYYWLYMYSRVRHRMYTRVLPIRAPASAATTQAGADARARSTTAANC